MADAAPSLLFALLRLVWSTWCLNAWVATLVLAFALPDLVVARWIWLLIFGGLIGGVVGLISAVVDAWRNQGAPVQADPTDPAFVSYSVEVYDALNVARHDVTLPVALRADLTRAAGIIGIVVGFEHGPDADDLNREHQC